MLRLLFALSTFAAVAGAEPTGTLETGRLAGLIAEARQRADCVLNFESTTPVFQSTEPKERLGRGDLTLRAVTSDDARAVRRAVEIYTDPRVMAMSGDRVEAAGIELMFMLGAPRLADAGRTGLVNFAIEIESTAGEPRIVGFAQASNSALDVPRALGLVNDRDRWFELSYHLDPAHWGQGVATAAVQTLVERLLKVGGAEGLYAQVDLNNVKSVRVLERAGFLEIERQVFPGHRGPTGSIHFALTRQDFENPPLKHGYNVRTYTDARGLEMVELVLVGEVPRGTKFTVDENTNPARAPFPSRDDRSVQLSIKPGGAWENHGHYRSVPLGNPFGGPLVTSLVELDRAIENYSYEGQLNTNAFANWLAETFRLQDLREPLRRVAKKVPVDLAGRTIFERRRVYESLARDLAEIPGVFMPLKLFVLNGEGIDILTKVDPLREP